MDLAEIRDVLARALPMRSPTFAPDDSPAVKTPALEDYMLAAAQINGELVEARHWLRLLENRLKEEWGSVEGWEVALRGPRGRATQAQIDAAKRFVAPAIYEAGGEARRLRESVEDQINRFAREERTVSRAYTLITGA